MSNQLKGGSYEINPQGQAIQKAGTNPAPRAAVTRTTKPTLEKKTGTGKTTSTSKG